MPRLSEYPKDARTFDLDADGVDAARRRHAELLGVPLRVTVGRRSLAAGALEVQVRRGAVSQTVPLDGAVEAIAELWRTLP